MNKDMQMMVIGLIVKLGIEGALIVLKNMQKVTTVDEAIVALEASAKMTWEDYKKNA